MGKLDIRPKVSWDEDMEILQCQVKEFDLYSINNMEHWIFFVQKSDLNTVV